MADTWTPEQLEILKLGAARASAPSPDTAFMPEQLDILGRAASRTAPPANEIPAREGKGVAGGAPRVVEGPLVLGAELAAKKVRENPVLAMTNVVVPFRDVGQLTMGAAGGVSNVARHILNLFGIEDKPDQLEQAMETFGRKMAPTDTSYDVGKGAMEAYTASRLIGAGARGAGAIANAAGAGKAVAPIVSSLESAGMTTGLKPTTLGGSVGNALLRVGGGAAAGATGAKLTGIDPYFGALVGGGLPALAVGGAYIGNLMGLGTPAGEVKAAQIMKEVLGPDVDKAMAALRNAKPGTTAAQALEDAGIKSEAFQSLAEIVKSAKPDEAYNIIATAQDAARRNVLARAAGGSTEAQQYAAREIARGMVNATTGPEREAALSAANETGRSIIDAQRRAALGSAVAEEQTAQAKRLLGLSERQAAKATAPVNAVEPSLNEIPMLRGPEQRQAGAFAQQAELKGEQAARLGRIFGESRRSAEAQLAEYEANGLKPLTPEAIVPALRARLSDPKFAGNKPMRAAYTQLIDDLEQARLPNGLIDADALAAIRKNSVNDTLSSLLQGQKPKTVRKAAAAAMSEINPLINKAIEDAGGVGWSEYLSKHTTMMHELVDRKTLAAEALRLYNDDPKGYVKLLRGGKLNTLTKVFGPGAYNIVDEMGPQYAPLAKVADEVARDLNIKRQITDRGAEVARRAIENNIGTRVLPRLIDYKIGLANDVMQHAQLRVRGKALEKLYDAFQSGRSAAEVFDKLPVNERGAIERVFGGREGWIKAMGQTFATLNQAIVQSNRPNAMAPPPRNAMSR